ncbi:hypothetical protein CDEF62S_02515 [Castellaniella defragrans]
MLTDSVPPDVSKNEKAYVKDQLEGQRCSTGDLGVKSATLRRHSIAFGSLQSAFCRVPKMRSPASPRPGMMYPFSFR